MTRTISGAAASWTAGSPRTVPLIESPRSTATPLVACLFASPLAWQDSHGKLHGIEGLDGDAEREAIAKALEERRSNEDQRERVVVDFRAATTEALQAALTSGVRVLHYSGHGHPQCLTFEDGAISASRFCGAFTPCVVSGSDGRGWFLVRF